MPVFDAVFGSSIALVHTRHEASAVHMADAWSRITGRVGIALVTGGPGHANAVSALYTAQMAEAPIVLLSGHAPNDQLGRGAFQEMRQAEMAAAGVQGRRGCAPAPSTSPATSARAIRSPVGPARAGAPELPTDVLEGAAARRTRRAPPRSSPSRCRSTAATAVMQRLAQASGR